MMNPLDLFASRKAENLFDVSKFIDEDGSVVLPDAEELKEIARGSGIPEEQLQDEILCSILPNYREAWMADEAIELKLAGD